MPQQERTKLMTPAEALERASHNHRIAVDRCISFVNITLSEQWNSVRLGNTIEIMPDLRDSSLYNDWVLIKEEIAEKLYAAGWSVSYGDTPELHVRMPSVIKSAP